MSTFPKKTRSPPIELNGTTPRLWRPAADAALHEPVTLAALALALLWDPASASP